MGTGDGELVAASGYGTNEAALFEFFELGGGEGFAGGESSEDSVYELVIHGVLGVMLSDSCDVAFVFPFGGGVDRLFAGTPVRVFGWEPFAFEGVVPVSVDEDFADVGVVGHCASLTSWS